MDTLSVFQEQSMLLYVIAGLLVVLGIIGLGVFIRLGEVRDALLQQRPQRAGNPQQSHARVGPTGTWRDRPIVRRDEPTATTPERPSQDSNAAARAYYSEK